MPSEGIRNMKAVASDVTDGFVTVNPIFLKTLSNDEIKALNHFLTKKQTEIRTEPLAQDNFPAIRKKNIRLQRISLALTVIKNYVKAKRLNIDVEVKPKKKQLRGI